MAFQRHGARGGQPGSIDDEKTLRARIRAALGRTLRGDPDRLGIHLEDEGGVPGRPHG
jgi:hypothetical protein